MKKTLIVTLFVGCFFAMKASAQTTPADTSRVFSIADSASFTGKYKYTDLPFDYMTITVKDGKLFFSGGEYSGPLTPIKDKKDVFDANGNAIFTFVRKENKVTDLEINYQGQIMSGKRE